MFLISPRIKLLLISFLVLNLPGAIHAQKTNDSLINVLKTAGQDTTRVQTLLLLGWQTRPSAPEKAFAMYNEALALSKELHYDKGISTSYNHLGVYYYRKGDYVEAAKSHMEALAIRKRTGDKRGVAKSYNNLGNVYSDHKNLNQALEYYKNAAATFQEIGDEAACGMIYLNIATIYIEEKNFREGLKFCEMAKQIAVNTNDLLLEAQSLNNMGAVYEGMSMYEEAYQSFMAAYKLSIEIEDKVLTVDVETNIGNQLRRQKKFNEAVQWHLDAEKLAREMEYMEGLRIIYLDLANDYIEQRNYEKALFYHIRFKDVCDSLFDAKNSAELNDLTARWQNEIRERKLAESEKEVAKRIEGEKRANLRMWFFAGGAIIILIFAVYVLIAFRQKQRDGKLLAIQKEKIEKANAELEIKNKDITDSIIYSRRIQGALMPVEDKVKSLFADAFVLYRPRDIVSGDFYWAEAWGEYVLLAAADCTGHGVPGALLSVVGINLLNQSLHVNGIYKPAPVLNALSRGMKKALIKNPDDIMQLGDGMDIALIAVDTKRNKLFFAGANNPMWLIRNGEVTEIKPDKKPVGNYIIDNNEQFTEHEMDLCKGDMIYLFTDGFADQFGGENGKKFKYKQLKELLVSIAAEPAKAQSDVLNSKFLSWKGNHEQVDDVLLIGVRIS
jgi:serine phosphatase RsbU (regulator of sigma subunit)